MFLVEAPLAALARHLLRELVELVDGHVVHVFVARVRQRLHGQLHVAVLPAAAGLLDVLVLGFRGLQNRFAIRDLRPADVRLHAEFAHHAVDDNFQVQLAHSGNQRLAGIVIRVHAERGIFLRQLGERGAHFFLVGFCLGFDRYGNNRRGEIDVLEDDRLFFVTKRVAGRYVLQPTQRRCRPLRPIRFLRACSHAFAADGPCARAFSRRVVNRLPRLQHAGINANVRQMADERVGHDLERQRRKRLIVRRAPQFRLVDHPSVVPSTGGTSTGDGK